MAEINTLIDKQDNFEIIRDKIAAILITERNNQKALATAASKDPALWDFEVFRERSNPFETLKSHTSAKPVVNVWYDTASVPEGTGNIFDRQEFDGVFNIDVVARGTSQDRAVGGLLSGDEDAFLNAHRIVRLVRNILMSAQYRYLDLRGVVSQRWVRSVESYRPEPDKNTSSLNTGGIRISFGVRFIEVSPQIALGVIEQINVQVKNAGDGSLMLDMEFNNDG